MKKLYKIFLLLFVIGIKSASAQTTEIEQLLLNVEKLTQFKQILTDMKKGYDIVSGGYNTVKDISQGNFSLHKTFLDALLEVSPTVKSYRKVGDIVSMEIRLVQDYKAALSRFKLNQAFNSDELDYISRVYDKLFKDSLSDLDELANVVTANKFRMNDDERLKAIDNIHANMQDKVQFLQSFNKKTSILAIQREKEKNDAASMSSAYGVNK